MSERSKKSVKLTALQEKVLRFIRRSEEKGLGFPKLEDIAEYIAVKSKSAALFHVRALEKKGLVKRQNQQPSKFSLKESQMDGELPQGFPFIGVIPAGPSHGVFGDILDYISFDDQYFGGGDLRVVRVSGESMAGDQISDGDLAIIRCDYDYTNRDILAVRVGEDEVTLKRILQKGGSIDLLPSNPDYSIQTVAAEQVSIIGKLVGLVRKGQFH